MDAEQLFPANPAKRAIEGNNLLQARFAYRQPRNVHQREPADTAIRRKQDRKETLGGNFDRTFHRIADKGGAMGNALSPVYDTTTEDLPLLRDFERMCSAQSIAG